MAVRPPAWRTECLGNRITEEIFARIDVEALSRACGPRSAGPSRDSVLAVLVANQVEGFVELGSPICPATVPEFWAPTVLPEQPPGPAGAAPLSSGRPVSLDIGAFVAAVKQSLQDCGSACRTHFDIDATFVVFQSSLARAQRASILDRAATILPRAAAARCGARRLTAEQHRGRWIGIALTPPCSRSPEHRHRTVRQPVRQT
jgi:hypothetical protein